MKNFKGESRALSRGRSGVRGLRHGGPGRTPRPRRALLRKPPVSATSSGGDGSGSSGKTRADGTLKPPRRPRLPRPLRFTEKQRWTVSDPPDVRPPFALPCASLGHGGRPPQATPELLLPRPPRPPVPHTRHPMNPHQVASRPRPVLSRGQGAATPLPAANASRSRSSAACLWVASALPARPPETSVCRPPPAARSSSAPRGPSPLPAAPAAAGLHPWWPPWSPCHVSSALNSQACFPGKNEAFSALCLGRSRPPLSASLTALPR